MVIWMSLGEIDRIYCASVCFGTVIGNVFIGVVTLRCGLVFA